MFLSGVQFLGKLTFLVAPIQRAVDVAPRRPGQQPAARLQPHTGRAVRVPHPSVEDVVRAGLPLHFCQRLAALGDHDLQTADLLQRHMGNLFVHFSSSENQMLPALDPTRYLWSSRGHHRHNQNRRL